VTTYPARRLLDRALAARRAAPRDMSMDLEVSTLASLRTLSPSQLEDCVARAFQSMPTEEKAEMV
jgi:hypothetical protein